MAEKKMDAAQARSFVRDEARKGEAWVVLADFLEGVENEFRTKTDTDASIAAMKRTESDMTVTLGNAQREHQTAMAGLETAHNAAITDNDRHKKELAKELTEARQRKAVTLETMAADQAKRQEDFEVIATERREHLAKLNKQISDAQATKIAMKEQLG